MCVSVWRGRQVCGIGSIGSGVAAGMVTCSLTVGWSIRMFERFCLDGWLPMQWAVGNATGILPLWRVLLAAFVSPTAVLHFSTGVTLLFGYAWMRAIEDAAQSA